MKQRILLVVPVIAGAVLAASADVAQAQNSGGRWRLPSQTAVRSGVQAPPPQPQPTIIIVNPQPLYYQPLYQRVVGLPTMLPCSSYSVTTRVIASNGVVLSQYEPPTYAQPVPSQMTASQQHLPSVRAAALNNRTVIISGETRAACYVTDASGRVYFYP